MAISVNAGVDKVQQGIGDVTSAPGKILDGDVKGAVSDAAGAGQKVKRGAIEAVLSLAKAPIDGLKTLLGGGARSQSVRDGTQRAIEKRL